MESLKTHIKLMNIGIDFNQFTRAHMLKYLFLKIHSMHKSQIAIDVNIDIVDLICQFQPFWF